MITLALLNISSIYEVMDPITPPCDDIGMDIYICKKLHGAFVSCRSNLSCQSMVQRSSFFVLQSFFFLLYRDEFLSVLKAQWRDQSLFRCSEESGILHPTQALSSIVCRGYLRQGIINKCIVMIFRLYTIVMLLFFRPAKVAGVLNDPQCTLARQYRNSMRFKI